jgi:ATP-binding cassette subfamily C protein
MTEAAPHRRTAGAFVEKSPIREALKLCGQHLRYAMLFSALVNVAYLAPTFYMLVVYDMVVPSSSSPSLIFATLALAASLMTLTYLDALRGRILGAASLRLDRVFASRIFRRAMLNAGGGPQPRVNQLIREFDTIRAAVTGPAALAMFDAPWIPLYLIVCFSLHFAIGALALGGSIILFILAVWNERRTRAFSDRALEASAASFGAQEAAGGSADVVRALGMTEAFVSQFEMTRDRASLPQMEAARANGQIGGLIRFLRLFLQSAALGLGAFLAINKQISGGAIFASSMLAARALGPIDQVVGQWRTVSQAISAYGAIRTHLKAEDPASRTTLPTPRPRLQVTQASVLAPAKDRALISGVTFAADAGQVVGVIGVSGAGKTTLMQVLANARTPDQGEVRIDGARYTDWDSERLGKLLGYLPQDCALFPGTVKDNISRFDIAGGADPARADEMAVAAAKVAGVHDLILSLPGGYDAMLGPRGRGLSAGQQQRIALARALYGDPILYIFDEPNSNLDSEGEAILIDVISRLRARGALVIVAAHRLSLIASADLLAVMRGGRVERFGPRAEVLESLKQQQQQAQTPSPAPAGKSSGAPVGALGGAR